MGRPGAGGKFKKMGLGKINPDEARCWPVSLSTSPAIKSSRQFRALASQKKTSSNEVWPIKQITRTFSWM